MSVVEDIRKVIPDLVTPDLKALVARVVALEQKPDLKFDLLDKKVDYKSHLLQADIRNLAAVVAANQAAIMHALDIDRRVERIGNTIAAKTN